MSDQEILTELKKINDNISRQAHKTVINSFLSGFFHAFGSFFGTLALFLLLFVFASQLNLTKVLSQQFEQFMSTINWEKVVPAPTIKFDANTLFNQ